MSPENTLIKIEGDYSKTATELIRRVSDAIGGLARPWQTRRVARAEADADRIRAMSQIEISELQQRAITRFVTEETQKQENIEAITVKAIEHLPDDAKPEEIETDWLANFFDKCKLVSDEEMQQLWAQILAGEAQTAGSYSKRTVNFVHSLDKSDAILFAQLCSFGWCLGNVVPLVFDLTESVYQSKGIHFGSLKHLDEIGLLTFNNISEFARQELPQEVTLLYYGIRVELTLPKEESNKFPLGKVLLSQTGQELAPICGSEGSHEFFQYTVEHWRKAGYKPKSAWPNNLGHHIGDPESDR